MYLSNRYPEDIGNLDLQVNTAGIRISTAPVELTFQQGSDNCFIDEKIRLRGEMIQFDLYFSK